MNTPYTFKIGSTDFSSLVKPYSYSTELSPVEGDSVMTLDGVTHPVVLRWKHLLHVELKPMTAAELATLAATISGNAFVSVQYTNLQTNTVVTENMMPSAQSAKMLLKNASHTYIGDTSLDFEQC